MSVQEFELTWTEAKASANFALFKNSGKYLTDIEIKVLWGSWQGKTYETIADIYGYSPEYLNKDIGNKLWKKLSGALGEKVCKKNFKEALTRQCKQQKQLFDLDAENLSAAQSMVELPFSARRIALNSSFYLEGEGAEIWCYVAVMKPGSLIQIQAPKIGDNTSLVRRILAYADHQNYQTVYLDLERAEPEFFKNLDRFLRWVCLKVGEYLQLENQLNQYWDAEQFGSNDNCTVYFSQYLLVNLNSPLVLAFDNADRILSSAEVGEDFLKMLQNWHDKGKISDFWKQLKLVLAYSNYPCISSLDRILSD